MHISEALDLLGYTGYPSNLKFTKNRLEMPDYELYNTF